MTRPRHRRRPRKRRPAGPGSRPPGQGGPEIELAIDRLGDGADGIGLYEGRTVFVPLTAPGDRIRGRLGAARGDGIAAHLVTVLEPGPDRVVPPCPHFGRCGGCLTQHLSADANRRWKRAMVTRALERAGLAAGVVEPVMAMQPGSRRRATFAARHGRDGVVLGFNAHRSHRIVDLETCAVLRPEIVALLPILRPAMASVLDRSGGLDAAVTLLDDGLDVLLIGDSAPDLKGREALARFAADADLARLSWRSGSGPAEPIAHRRTGTLDIGGVPVTVPPGGFLQPTAAGAAALTGLVTAAVGDAGPVADLFCGSGTFALPLSSRARVFAVDSDGASVAALTAASRRASPPRPVETATRDLMAVPLTPAELNRFGAVLFDPPRSGARDQAASLAASAVPLVVAVSCQPASFARDARLLCDGGYRLERVTPVDQFLWSPHLELVGVFRR
ncbi:MAG: class I SAM-dependent RNA methyltransferase [Inquilinaceae bacterium]